MKDEYLLVYERTNLVVGTTGANINTNDTKSCCRDDDCYERVCNHGICAAGYNTPCKV